MSVLAAAGGARVLHDAIFFPPAMHRRLRSWLTLAHVLLGTVGQLSSRRSVVEVVAEAASRGVRYDKYFAIGKFSHHIFSPGYCRSCAPGIIWHHCQFFSCISPRNGVLVFRNKFSETITCRPILSGGCELSHGFAVIDLSLEQPERAQGFLDTVCTEIARPICL